MMNRKLSSGILLVLMIAGGCHDQRTARDDLPINRLRPIMTRIPIGTAVGRAEAIMSTLGFSCRFVTNATVNPINAEGYIISVNAIMVTDALLCNREQTTPSGATENWCVALCLRSNQVAMYSQLFWTEPKTNAEPNITPEDIRR